MNDDTAVRAIFEVYLHHMMRLSMHGLIRYAKESGFSMSQIGALFQIHRGKMCGVSEVGDDLGITSAAASQMLDRLFQQGLIEREEDPADRRSKRLSLTEKGQAVVKESMYARQGWVPSIIDSLSEEEKDIVVQGIKILTEKASLLGEGSLSSVKGRQDT